MTPINCPKPHPHKPHGKALPHDHCPNAGIPWPVAAPDSDLALIALPQVQRYYISTPAPPCEWTASSVIQYTPSANIKAAPEIDPGSAHAALAVLAMALAVLIARRDRRQ
jgi:MYXO-CTERM domain-containing protein